MQERFFEMKFLTPAFLGDAEQKGVWRTPPIKALLRQWWRVAYAAQHDFRSHIESDMRREEGKLFGHAWLEDDRDAKGDKVTARRSFVRLRLERWDEGKLKRYEPFGNIFHPEVHRNIDAGLYLGYGPVTLPRGANTPQFKANAAIQATEFAQLRLAYPEDRAQLLQQALWLMDRFGTLGGRGRNGWGSFSLTEKNPVGTLLVPLRDWRECLDRDWPHAIGKDEQGALIWQTAPQTDWKKVMLELAKLKLGLRTQFSFTSGKNAPRPEERHWLSYPVTNHSVAAWGGNFRLPNSLRFKVRSLENDQLVGTLFHVPCLPLAQLHPGTQQIETAWQKVHRFLDTQMPRSKP
jgi:CRISPR-associated protein Cmr1